MTGFSATIFRVFFIGEEPNPRGFLPHNYANPTEIFPFRDAQACAHFGIPSVAARGRVPKTGLRRQGRRSEGVKFL